MYDKLKLKNDATYEGINMGFSLQFLLIPKKNKLFFPA